MQARHECEMCFKKNLVIMLDIHGITLYIRHMGSSE